MADIILKNVCYKYSGKGKDILTGVDAEFPSGTITAICGRSGAGKSTMMYLLSGLDVPTQGEILYNGKPLHREMLDDYRRKDCSTIAQSYLLFPTRTALENVLYPMELAGQDKAEASQKAKEYLLSVGISPELHNRLPGKMSGGEQQRVAIARCLAANADIIAADEPTGNLDEDNADAVLALLKDLAHNKGKTVIIVTHDRYIADEADRQYRLEKGKLRLI